MAEHLHQRDNADQRQHPELHHQHGLSPLSDVDSRTHSSANDDGQCAHRDRRPSIGQRVQVQRLQQVDGAICAPLPTATVAAINAAQPASQPTQGVKAARRVKVIRSPASASRVHGMRRRSAASGGNPITNSPGVLAPTTATMPASTAADCSGNRRNRDDDAPGQTMVPDRSPLPAASTTSSADALSSTRFIVNPSSLRYRGVT